MKNLLLIIYILLLVGSEIFAQCPVSVQISAIPTNPICKNTLVNLTANPTNGGVNPQYFWVLNGDTVSTSSNFSTSQNFANVSVYLISSNGCPQDTAISNYTINTISLTASYNVIVTECNQPVADIEIINQTGGIEPYTWNLITSSGNLGQENLYPDISVSSYPLFITDGQGCTDTTWINMDIVQCPPPTPTEVITPNGDDVNDTWYIYNIQYYPDNEVFIFDRWGQRVYHKKGYNNKDGWEVKYIGLNLPVSTYYYILKIKFEKSKEQVFNGPISIFR